MDHPDSSNSASKRALYLWRTYLKEHKKTLFWAIVAGAISAACAGMGIPVIIEKVFPIVFGEKPLPEPIKTWAENNFSPESIRGITLWGTAALLPLAMMVKGAASFLNVYYMSKVGLKVLEKLRLSIFKRLQELPLSFHEKHKKGDLLSRMLHDAQYLQDNMLNMLNDLVIQPLTLLAAFCYLLYASLAESSQVSSFLLNMLLAMACVPIVKKCGNLMFKRAGKAFSGIGEITSTIQENLASQRDVRAFNLEKYQTSKLKEQIELLLRTMMRMTAWRQTITPAIEIVSALALAFSLYVGRTKGISLIQFTAIATALYYCYEPIKKIGVVHNMFKLTEIILKRVNDVIYAKDKLPEPENPIPLGNVNGKITYDHVTFSYDRQNDVLKDINLEIKPGEIVALVGPSGSGKTTFINLLSRFYDVGSGSIKIDDIDIRDIANNELRESIALISQHPVLFRGTILENIRIGKPEASDEEVIAMARMASVDEFVESFPEGYGRRVGESGEGLSGGQRQRVSIARAFLKNAPILILDEATASLDMTSEAKIQASLQALLHGRTAFIIAHRFSTIRMATRILVFEEGKIIAEGTHEDLYNSSALYRELYDKQIAQKKEVAHV